ncbi:carboxypeptidase regulatory-like domain-containing protein [Actinotalea sp. K2]|uniref:carboxypeptidase regulatory-like domain-containing protein n=1 Tax=Actinotalea sp. K2 TaxID=2939438 RepID=UPI00201733CB|nr:carboxypeptidase regulatory-like domain-containing protein [Actinotalea sp. K2]MCL3861863.1 carboxypeptidase regulatory-like domain-containing protein [Actinotalea sp. K2]
MSSLRPTGDLAPSVLVEPDAHGASGQEAVVRVHLRNLADGPRDITVTTLGLDGEWLPLPRHVADVPADATISVDLLVRIGPGAVPGTYPFALAVQAQVSGRGAARAVATMVEGELRVDAPSTVMMGVEPAESSAVFGRRVSVVLSNSGEQDVRLRLAVRPVKGMRVELTDEQVRVPARSTVRLPARLTVLHPQVVGHRNRRTFVLAATGDQAPARSQAVLTARPLLGSGAIRALSMLVVAALWLTGVVIGAPWIAQRVGTESTLAGGSGAGVGAEGSEPGSRDGDAQDQDAPAGRSEHVRIGGIISAADPAGFRVQVVPASQIVGGDAGPGQVTPAAAQLGQAQSGGAGDGSAQVLTAALAVPAASDGAPLGKVPASSLALVRTEVADAARSTASLEDGTWAFAGMSPLSNYLITLSKQGFQTQRFVMTGAEAAASLIKVEMVAGSGSLSGRVVGPQGAVGGVAVTLTDGTNVVTTSTATEGDVGRWSVEGLSTPSTFLVTAAGEGFGAQSRLVDLAAGASREVDLTLDRGVAALAGTVTGPDALGGVGGLGGVTVTATDGVVTRSASTVTSGRTGAFILADLPVPSTYTVTVSGDGFASHTSQVTLGTGADAATLDVRLGLSTGVVQGTLVDGAGLGKGGAGLTLSDGENTYKTMSTSDDRGTFRFNGIVPGDYVLSAELFGHLDAFAPVTVTAGRAVSSDLMMTVIPGDGLLSTSFIRGRVSDARTNGVISCSNLQLEPDGTPERCEITVTLTAPAADGSIRTIEVTSDPDLEYTVPAPGAEGLLPGLYTLTLSAPGYEPGRVRVQVAMGETVVAAQVALFPSPSVVGTVLTRVGAVPAGTCVVARPTGESGPLGDCVTAQEPDGEVSCTITGGAQCASTRPDGSYALERLGSGQFDVMVVPGDDEYLTVPAVAIVLTPGDVRRYDATLDRLARLALTVLTDSGSTALLPAPGAVVTPVRLSDGPLTPRPDPWRTGADGRVLVTHLPPGSYRFDIAWETVPEGETATISLTASTAVVTLGTNQEIAMQAVLTRPRASFQGVVTTQLSPSALTPVPGASVQLSGVTGYSGLVPVTTTATVLTGADGVFEVVPTPADVDETWKVYLPLVTDQVSITVRVPGASPGVPPAYRELSWSNVTIADLTAPLVLEPTGRPFVGTMTFLGGASLTPAQMLATEFDVERAPPGAGSAGVRAVATGTPGQARLVWGDLSQPADGDGTMVRPGVYRVRASLAGFDSTVVDFTVPVLPDAYGPITLDLPRFGELTVAVVAGAPPGSAVQDPVVTLIRPASGNITTAAIAGTNEVSFGEVASGSYQVLVQAAGHAFHTFTVTVAPGQTNAVPVTVTKLGAITGTVSVQTSTGATRTLSGVLVRAEQAGGRVFTATTDTSGGYRITGTASTQGLVEGTWTVTVVAPGYGLADGAPSRSVPVAGGTEVAVNLLLRATPVDLRLTVYDPENAGSTEVDRLQVALVGVDGTVTIDCATTTDTCPSPTTDGLYLFPGIEPGSYTLAISGGGFAPLTVSITVAAGEPTVLSLPIAARTNTVIGTVSGQAGAAAAVPLDGATVDLLEAGTQADLGYSTTTTDGAFTLVGVADGSYVLAVDATGYSGTSRAVTVRGGQVLSVDLVLYTVTRQVTVTVTSEQGFDLTGALVALDPEATGGLSLAAQPVVRAGGGEFRTTFNQVPPGAWTASVSGPTGHYGVTSAPVAEGATVVALVVSEVRVRVVATSTATDAPASLPFVITRSSGAGTGTVVVDGSVGIGAGAEVVHLDRTSSYTITPAVAGWTISPTTRSIAIASAGPEVTASFTLARTGTTTTLAAAPHPVSPGQVLTLTASVTTQGGTAGLTGGTVTFLRDGVELTPDVTVSSSGGTRTAVLTPDTSAWTGGVSAFTARFNGTGTHAGSTTATATSVTVRVPTTTALVSPPATIDRGSPATLAVRVTGPGGDPVVTGSVTFLHGSTVLGTSTVDTTGGAGLDLTGAVTAGLALGTSTLTARYVQTTTHTGSEVSSVVTVYGVTVAALVASPSTGVATGEIVTFTPTRSPGGVPGTFTVYRGTAPNGVSVGTAGIGGTVAWTATGVSQSFYAIFRPGAESYYRASTSPPVTVTAP